MGVVREDWRLRKELETDMLSADPTSSTTAACDCWRWQEREDEDEEEGDAEWEAWKRGVSWGKKVERERARERSRDKSAVGDVRQRKKM